MEQTTPFPSPEDLKSKLAEFMKSNFGDRVAFTTLTQPDTVEAGTDEKSPRNLRPRWLRAARRQSLGY